MRCELSRYRHFFGLQLTDSVAVELPFVLVTVSLTVPLWRAA